MYTEYLISNRGRLHAAFQSAQRAGVDPRYVKYNTAMLADYIEEAETEYRELYDAIGPFLLGFHQRNRAGIKGQTKALVLSGSNTNPLRQVFSDFCLTEQQNPTAAKIWAQALCLLHPMSAEALDKLEKEKS